MAERVGFQFLRQRGAHRRYGHTDGRRTTIPFHQGRDLGVGLFHKILKELAITEEDFNRLR